MTLREAESPRHQTDSDRALDDMRVLSIAQWCRLNGFSFDTGKRLIKRGQGPVITQISDRRIGVTVANNRAWQRSRERV
jgi:predicted site-specific integrase-resolvase